MSTSASETEPDAGVRSLRGDFYDGVSSQRAAARLEIARDGLATLVVEGRAIVSAPLRALTVSARVGNVPCAIRFAGGGTFSTPENDLVDRALTDLGAPRAGSRLHGLESRWSVVLVGIAVVALFVRWLVAIGLPKVAERVAFAVPPEAAQKISRHTLDVLDRTMFAPTTLPAERQDQLRARLDGVVAAARSELHFQLHFRASPTIGANAFALPSGDVVLTDELVALATHDDEIVAVLAHEVGHVVHRHALRSVIQASGLTLLVLAVSGDAGAVSSFTATVPTMLVEMRYSREHEREADRHALEYLRAAGIAPASFTSLLDRIVASAGGADDGPAFLSTHPSPAERRAMFADR